MRESYIFYYLGAVHQVLLKLLRMLQYFLILINKTEQVLLGNTLLYWLGTSIVHMVVGLQDGPGSVSGSLQMNLPMVESGEALVTALAGVRPEQEFSTPCRGQVLCHKDTAQGTLPTRAL